MAEAGGAFVTRAFERMLKDSAGRKYGTLQTALKAYLGERLFPPDPGVFASSVVCLRFSV